MDLQVGAICVWYPHADTNQRPSVGIVTAIKRPGILTLYKFPAAGGMPTMIDNVHHVDSTRIAENQNLRLEYGGWDTVETEEKRRQADLNKHAPVIPTVLPSPDIPEEEESGEDAIKLNSYYEEGMTVDQIAEKMGRGWGPKKVSIALKQSLKPTA